MIDHSIARLTQARPEINRVSILPKKIGGCVPNVLGTSCPLQHEIHCGFQSFVLAFFPCKSSAFDILIMRRIVPINSGIQSYLAITEFMSKAEIAF